MFKTNSFEDTLLNLPDAFGNLSAIILQSQPTSSKGILQALDIHIIQLSLLFKHLPSSFLEKPCNLAYSFGIEKGNMKDKSTDLYSVLSMFWCKK